LLDQHFHCSQVPICLQFLFSNAFFHCLVTIALISSHSQFLQSDFWVGCSGHWQPAAPLTFLHMRAAVCCKPSVLQWPCNVTWITLLTCVSKKCTGTWEPWLPPWRPGRMLLGSSGVGCTCVRVCTQLL
jgi:hypothetical protein